jgi:hypothetical protein
MFVIYLKQVGWALQRFACAQAAQSPAEPQYLST